MRPLLTKIIAFLIFTSIGYRSYSQSTFVEGGALISEMYSLSDPDNDNLFDEFEPLVGMTFGISRNFNLSNKILLSPIISFTTLGSKYTLKFKVIDPDPAFNSVEEDYIKINYVYLSIPVTYQLSQLLEFDLGPQLGYQVSRKIESNSGVERDFFKSKFDYGLLVGLRVNVTDKISSTLRFYNGFGKVEYMEFLNWRTKNRYLSLNLAYRIIQKGV